MPVDGNAPPRFQPDSLQSRAFRQLPTERQVTLFTVNEKSGQRGMARPPLRDSFVSLRLTLKAQVARSILATRLVPSRWQPRSTAGAEEQLSHGQHEVEDAEGGMLEPREAEEDDTTRGWGAVVAEIWEVRQLFLAVAELRLVIIKSTKSVHTTMP
jgi:hypothetical protein